jgi:hypothetical protein
MPFAAGRDRAQSSPSMRERRAWRVAGIGLVAATVISRWPFRSRFLFSWDSANFALGIARIDIAQHRPHPPGYLGYVLAARALNAVLHDANTAMVLWNIAATALAALVIGRFAWECAGRGHRAPRAVAPVRAAIGLGRQLDDEAARKNETEPDPRARRDSLSHIAGRL